MLPTLVDDILIHHGKYFIDEKDFLINFDELGMYLCIVIVLYIIDSKDILLEIFYKFKGTDFDSKILDICGNEIKTNTTTSIPLIF